MPDQIEKTFGKTVESKGITCGHSTAILSLGKGKGIVYNVVSMSRQNIQARTTTHSITI